MRGEKTRVDYKWAKIISRIGIVFVCIAIAAISKDAIPSDRDDNDKDGDRKLRICILCEPAPMTHMSGQASRFRLLMQHFSDNHYDTHEMELVTADVVHPSPPTDCFDGFLVNLFLLLPLLPRTTRLSPSSPCGHGRRT